MTKKDKNLEPLIIYQKNADKTSNKILLPKFVIDKMGRNYLMEIYEDKIVLKPFDNKEKVF